MSGPGRVALASVLLSLAFVVGADGVEGQTAARLVLYVQPVDAAVIDGFRPPAHIGAPGNRGLEYGIATNALVVASADGVVSFAGQVAGRGVIVVEHLDGLRTTYTGMTDLWAVPGAQVVAGMGLGTAGPGFHFGARIADEYLDPQILLEASQPEQATPRLVLGPDHPARTD